MHSRAHAQVEIKAEHCPPLRMRAPSILTLSFASRSARPSMSALTISTWPFLEAAMSGIHPFCRRDAEEERNTASHSAAAVLHCVVALFNTIMHGRLRRSFIRGPSARRRGAASSRAAETEWRVREQHHIARHSQPSHGTCATAMTATVGDSFPLPCSSPYYARGGAASSSLGHCTQRVSSRLTLPQCTDTAYTRMHTCTWRHGDIQTYTHTHPCMHGCI
jgi:hypothetical protein